MAQISMEVCLEMHLVDKTSPKSLLLKTLSLNWTVLSMNFTMDALKNLNMKDKCSSMMARLRKLKERRFRSKSSLGSLSKPI
mmetsp:Transcript_8330/g.6220  ORF Transcript_8330/g.6220 Transcript_8330/m.6220 type:complete len:82 (+) Transcript_8330:343-588(+)